MPALISTNVLIPLRDNEGLPFPWTLFDELARRLLDLQADDTGGGGFSTRAVSGVWVYQGRTFRDESTEYAIAFDSWLKVVEWFAVVQWARAAFRQEALFVTVLGVSEAIGP